MERKMTNGQHITMPSLLEILDSAPWQSMETHLDGLRESIDSSISANQRIREEYRQQLLSSGLAVHIRRPTDSSFEHAKNILRTGTVAASDGTISPVPLLSGSKIQVGVVIVSNKGEVVDLVTRVFEAELATGAANARDFFVNLQLSRTFSNLLARAIMLFGERRLLLEHESDWRFMHGELIPHELRTGAGRPSQNLQPTFDLINAYIRDEKFVAVSEASNDIDILNAAIVLEPGEYIVIRSLEDTLTTFLDGDEETEQAGANFNTQHRSMFRNFIRAAGPQVAVVLVKAGPKPFLIECHVSRIEEAVSLFLIDSLWTRGLQVDGTAFTIRGFPFHIDLADQIARTLFKGSDFRNFVESRLFDIGLESGLFDIDPRRTR
jgi:hypothetical protein